MYWVKVYWFKIVIGGYMCKCGMVYMNINFGEYVINMYTLEKCACEVWKQGGGVFYYKYN